MESRIDKYNDSGEISVSRTRKNASLYKEINETDITEFDSFSNATVLDNNGSVIDVDKLRDMLDKKYRDSPRKVNFTEVNKDDGDYKVNLDETREYDINSILNKAKSNKDSDYEVERLKKLRNTQMDILSGLNINKEEDTSGVTESDKLRELIDTINLKEKMANDEIDPLDILSDLKGNNENTVVLGASEDILKEATKEAPAIKGVDKPNNESSSVSKNLDNTSITTTNTFTESDFDDFNDLKEEVASNKIMLKVLIAVVIIAFIVGVVFILNKYLGLGLF